MECYFDEEQGSQALEALTLDVGGPAAVLSQAPLPTTPFALPEPLGTLAHPEIVRTSPGH
jgi:hypothetical protein